MTSLNTRTGWDASKQTGSNFTSEIIEKSREGFRRGREVRSGSDHHHPSSVKVTPSSSSASSSTSSTSSPPLLTLGGPGSNTELTFIESPSDLNMTQQRDAFFRDNYDYRTGVRIASTLGGFFLLVLLTLLYKSKCKGKHSREPSMHSVSYPAIHPGHLMGGQNLQLNGGRDFGGGGGSDHRGGGGGGGNQSPTHAMPMTLLDSTCYGYMNQVHPANSHQPIFSNYYGSAEGHVKSPAVLLITAANSESSDEELSIVSATDQREALIGGPEVPLERINRGRNPIGPVPPCRQVLYSSDSQCYLHPRSKSPPMKGGTKGNIDINVILPTPSISPSGSENFNMNKIGGANQTLALFQGSHSDKRRLLTARSLSSENEDISETNGEGESECSDAQAMLPFGCVNSSMFSLENLKYVDDTSSENIPTRGSDPDEQDQDTRSIGSDSVFACFEHNFDHIAPTYARRVSSVSGTSSGVLGAISPQALHRQYSTSIPPPPGVTTELVKTPGGPASSSGFGEGEETELRVTLTQAQVHHRDSFCSDLESINDYMETGARRRSSSTQTTLSDLRQALGTSPTSPMGWSGGGTSPGTTSLGSCPSHDNNARRLSVPRRRRSLSPNMNPATTTTTALTPPGQQQLVSSTSNSTATPFLSVTLHPAPPATLLVTGGSKGTDPMSPETPTNPPVTSPMMMLSPSDSPSPLRMMRKRSFDAVKKSLSLQCEDKADVTSLFTATSSNETTPTN